VGYTRRDVEMSPGTLLFGIAVAVAVAAYVARPFRRAPDDLDAIIEAWIAHEARRLPDPAEDREERV
jgi:hypothetical protein